MSDEVRIRAEGACEVLEAASERFRVALEAWKSEAPCVLPALSAEEEAAHAVVKRLDAAHASVAGLDSARSELTRKVEAWASRFGFTPTEEDLPIAFSGTMWRVSLLPLRANVVITARELIVGSKKIALDSMLSCQIEAGAHVIVEYSDGTVTLTPDDERELELVHAPLRSHIKRKRS